jgi:hypothetical protein
VLDEQDGQPEVGQRPQQADERLGLVDVETRGGLVEHEELRGAAQGPGQFDRAQIAERQCTGRGGEVTAEADHAGHPLGPIVVGQAAQRRVEDVAELGRVGRAAPEDQVLAHRQAPEQPRGLERAAQAAPAPGGRRPLERLAVEDEMPGVGGEQPRQAVEERGLARTVRSDDAGHLARAGGERHAVEGLDATESDRQVVHGEDLAAFGPATGHDPAGGLDPFRHTGPALGEALELGEVDLQRTAAPVAVPTGQRRRLGVGAPGGDEGGGPAAGFGAERVAQTTGRVHVVAPSASTRASTRASARGLVPSTRCHSRRARSARPPGAHRRMAKTIIPAPKRS